MKVAIVPFATLEQSENIPVYIYFKARGAEITIFYWGEPELPSDVNSVKIEPKEPIPGLEEFDLVVHGPIIRPEQMVGAKKITTLTNIFLENCSTKNIIGVTGTKGKGTTSTLIAKMLEADGKTVHIGGNIGVPALNLLPNIKPEDWVILELSSFQLIDAEKSPPIAVCVMVVPEHLDWHKDLDEYIRAKQNLFKYQNYDDVAIYNIYSELSQKVVGVSKAKKMAYDVPEVNALPAKVDFAHVNGAKIFYNNTEICDTADVKLLGRHNLENICASINAAWGPINGNIDAIKSVISTFSGLEHRIEFVRELNGVKYYDDSFATTPETSIACIRAFADKPKVMILGGSDKGIEFDSLADEVAKSNVKHAIIIGDTANTIATLLQKRNFTNYTLDKSTMTDIVKTASERAESGDVVLLSTGCASFGLFRDYKDRGDQFKQAVLALV